MATEAFSCTPRVFEVPFAEAVIVAAWAVETAVEVAVNPAEVEPAATVIDTGTVSAEFELPSKTETPPDGAAVFSVTVQLSVVAPVSVLLVQLREPRIALPVPERLIGVVLLDELLEIVT